MPTSSIVNGIQSSIIHDSDDVSLIKRYQISLPQEMVKPTKVLECDEKTADSHVPRDSRLIRLTGIHPFNCEPPLPALFDSGFITPAELWFVRNHGAVPQVLDTEVWNWEFSIEGLVQNPFKMTLKELLKLEQITLPVTMVCAGNRRKEQNVVRKGNGFNWGSAGVSTALFTGVLMKTVLDLAKPTSSAKYMCMEGVDKLPNGYYGTSIRLSTAMNPSMGVMLSHMMNGELLMPDHGRPLRVVIPGQIGGRSVKWLKRIIITENPSDNWYHIFDNRVLPTMITPDIAAAEKFWYKDERYALYSLNVQSVTCCPAHDEVVAVQEGIDYNVRGYAYNGGGVRVGRVELSLDQGKTWRLANIDYPEDHYRKLPGTVKIFGGRIDMNQREEAFCWCFWQLQIPTLELANAQDLVVRAMDESMNAQPRDMYWNVLSMLNNCWHRLSISKSDDGSKLIFEHPTIPASTNGGWMEKIKDLGGNLTDGFWGSRHQTVERAEGKTGTTVNMINESVTRIITEEELAKHKEDGDAWFAVQGHVYDAGEYLKEHPGGADSIILASGADATDDFMAIHSDTAKAMMSQYHIGTLQASKGAETFTSRTGSATKRPIFLNQKQWSICVIKSKRILNHDSIYLTLALEHPNQSLGLPIGKALYIRCISNTGEKVVRSYTPISDPNQLGTFDLIIKLYLPAGKMSTCIDRLQPGDSVECKGPFGDYEYQTEGIFLHRGIAQRAKKITMIAGGSGITAMYPIFKRACADGIDCDLIYCNKTEDDILLRDELATFKCVRHCLSRPKTNWTGLKGHIDAKIIGSPHEGILLCCGPTGMMETVRRIAQNGGWNMDEQVFFF